MWPIIIEAIISLLIYFFEKWWSKSQPFSPSQYREAFLSKVTSIRYFWMGPQREVYAALLFDKFQANYDADRPPAACFLDRRLSPDEATGFAKKYAKGLTLSPSEVVRDKGKSNR